MTSALPAPTGVVGVYVHVPFCARHCPYCDFAVTVTARPPLETFVSTALAELERRIAELEGRRVETLYLGGGTPSMLGPGGIVRLVRGIRERVGATSWREITVEANPEHATRALLDAFVDAGVTRVSWGAQSLDARALAALGRAHGPDDVRRAVALSREAGLAAVSVDLIYGLPGQGSIDAARDAEAMAALDGVSHVSAYELTWEPRTAFSARRDRGALHAPSPDHLEDVAERVADVLGSAGLVRYEVSNWARPGAESRHNAGYWRGHEYLGIGPGAHSLRVAGGRAERRANDRSLRRWLDAGGDAEAWRESLDAHAHLGECAMLALRTAEGLDVAAFRARFGDAALVLAPLAARWAEAGLGTWDGAVFAPGPRGLQLADSLAVQMLNALDAARPNGSTSAATPARSGRLTTEDATMSSEEDGQNGNGGADGIEDDLFLDPDEDAAGTDGASAADPLAEMQAKVEALEAEKRELNDRFLRKAADVENQRRRHLKEKEELQLRAGEAVLREIVGVLDDLERAVDHASAFVRTASVGDEFAPVSQGLEMVTRKFLGALERNGVTPVSAQGQRFDPTIHEAIQQVEDPDVPSGTVVREFQKAYLLHGRLLRPALVVVAQGGAVVPSGDYESVGEDSESPEPASEPEDGGGADGL